MTDAFMSTSRSLFRKSSGGAKETTQFMTIPIVSCRIEATNVDQEALEEKVQGSPEARKERVHASLGVLEEICANLAVLDVDQEALAGMSDQGAPISPIDHQSTRQGLLERSGTRTIDTMSKTITMTIPKPSTRKGAQEARVAKRRCENRDIRQIEDLETE